MSVVHTKTNSSKVFYFIFLSLLMLLPFHAFLSTWLGDILGNRILIQSWKEIITIVLSSYTFFWAVRDRALGNFLLHNTLNKIVLGYGLLQIIILAFTRPETSAALHGIKINLEFLALFICAQAIIWRARPKNVDTTLSNIIITGGFIVGIFGTVQGFFLPKDFLMQFGYGPDTILPYLPISGDSDLFRVLSTLGGPNQLGQYLILPIMCAIHRGVQSKKLLISFLILPMISAMYFSHSRAAWIGLILALLVYIWRTFGIRNLIIGLIAIVAIAGAGGFLFLRNLPPGSTASYIVFHGSSATNSVSNNDHILAVKDALTLTAKHPFGHGPGTAGPAAYYLKTQPAVISENYYLQLAIEVGVLGFILFLALLLICALALVKLPLHNALGLPLLATLAGWSVINLVSHGWADSTASLLWWGSAGAIIRKHK